MDEVQFKTHKVWINFSGARLRMESKYRAAGREYRDDLAHLIRDVEAKDPEALHIYQQFIAWRLKHGL